MIAGHRVKLVREGSFVAEVEVDLIEDGTGWGPYLSLADAERLDHVRTALKAADIDAAAKLARVYRLTPVAAR
jgi:hypothetical protein